MKPGQWFFVYRDFSNERLMRASSWTGALSAARNQCGPHRPVVTIRDALGGLRAELHAHNERQGEFGREWDIREVIT